MIETIKSYGLIGLTLLIVSGYYLFSIKINEIELQRDLAIAKNQTLQQMIETQNKAIKDWKQKSLLAQSKLDNAQKKAHENYKQSQKKSCDIMTLQVPKECTQAMKWAVDEVERINND